jgi:hypothetical protein
MISQIVEIAEELSRERRRDPEIVARMDVAAQGQFPRFLLISPIDRSAQDLQLFGMLTGEAFQGTRMPGMPLLPSNRSPTLFSGPAAYNGGFSSKRGVILSFEMSEPEQIIRESLDNLMQHPDIAGLPVLVFRIDYDLGRARIFPHGKGRDYEAEIKIVSRLRRPDVLDSSTLVLICSDSRVRPPVTPKGLPMGIRSLAGFIPRCTGSDDETRQLSDFFSSWLSTQTSPKILIVAHGNFEGESSSCGAAEASLVPEEIKNPILHTIILEIQEAVFSFEGRLAETPDERAKSILYAVRTNLMTYSAIKEFAAKKSSDFIETLLMDTVTNVLFPADT